MPPTKTIFLKEKMKIFQTIQRQYTMLGISSSNRLSQKYPFNSPRVLSGFLLFGCSLGSQFERISHVTSGFMEYMECMCEATAVVVTFVCFATIVFNSDLLFENITKIENLIDTSKTCFQTNCTVLSITFFASAIFLPRIDREYQVIKCCE